MDSLPIWVIWSTIPGVVVLAPVLAFLLAVAILIIVGLLKEVGVPAIFAFIAEGGAGCLLLREVRGRWRSLSVVITGKNGGLGRRTRHAVANFTPFLASTTSDKGRAAR